MELVRMNTLRHYTIHSKATLRVVEFHDDGDALLGPSNGLDDGGLERRSSSAGVGGVGGSSSAPRGRSDSLLKLGRRASKVAGHMVYTPWHLVRPMAKQGGVDVMPQEVFLTYMLTVKGIIQPYANTQKKAVVFATTAAIVDSSLIMQT